MDELVAGVIFVFVLILAALAMSAYALKQISDLEKKEEIGRNGLQRQLDHLYQVNKERSDTAIKVQQLASLAPNTKLKMLVEMDGSVLRRQDTPKTVEWHLLQLSTMSHANYMRCVQNCRYEIVKE